MSASVFVFSMSLGEGGVPTLCGGKLPGSIRDLHADGASQHEAGTFYIFLLSIDPESDLSGFSLPKSRMWSENY